MGIRRAAYGALLLSVLLSIPGASLLADETIRKVDIRAVGTTGSIEQGIDIASGGQPTPASIEALSEAGFAAVIDLRGESEQRGYDEKALVEKRGMSYVSLPVTKAEDFSFEKASELDELIASFDGPVLVHCGSGNRAGALLALRAAGNGASAEEAIELGKEAGLTRSEGIVREVLEGE